MTETQATIIIAELFGIFWILLGMFFNIGERRHPVSSQKEPSAVSVEGSLPSTLRRNEREHL